MTTVPATPDWVMARRNNKDSVSLNWNPTFGRASYTVYRKKVNSFGVSSSYTPIASNLTDPYYVDKTATFHNGVKYSYYVIAKIVIGESPKSFEAQTDDQPAVLLAVPLIVFLTTVIFVNIFRIARMKKNPLDQSESVDGAA